MTVLAPRPPKGHVGHGPTASTGSLRDAFTSLPPNPLDAVLVGPGRVERDGVGAVADGSVGVAARPSAVVPAALAESLPDGSVRCHACAHRCLIRPARQGICHVRENRDGSLVSLVYGQAVAATLEPIEKKPLYHAWPGSRAYSISTVGCDFHCRFCQNWAIAQASRERTSPPTAELPPDEVVARARVGGARVIAYTYVEPTVFIEYVLDTARLARAAGLGSVLVTNGYQTPEALELLAPYVDAVNVDLKGFNDRFYRRVCGARLEPVLEALVLMRRLGWWIEITTLVIPGVNDDPSELFGLAEWIATELGPETPWHVSRFFPAYRMTEVPPTPLGLLADVAALGRRAGLTHVYPGNAPELGGTDTRCGSCDRILIRRRRHHVVENVLVDEACPGCGTRLAGIGLDRSRRSVSA